MQILESGVNHVNGVEFHTTQLRKYKDEARSLAIKAAQEKAETIAFQLNQQLGKPLFVREEQSSWQSWKSRWQERESSSNTSLSRLRDDVDENNLAPGKVSIKANVVVGFELIG